MFFNRSSHPHSKIYTWPRLAAVALVTLRLQAVVTDSDFVGGMLRSRSRFMSWIPNLKKNSMNNWSARRVELVYSQDA